MSLADELVTIQDQYWLKNPPHNYEKQAEEVDKIYEELINTLKGSASNGNREIDVNFFCHSHYLRYIEKRLFDDGFIVRRLGCRFNIEW